MLLRTVNLEEGLPSVEQARTRLVSEITSARSAGTRLLKVIHGYGSSGVGGDLRIALQGDPPPHERGQRNTGLYLRRKLAQK
jgi:hypothetical protein